MKVYLDLPWGGKFEMTRERMSEESIDRLFWLAVLLIVTKVFLAFFELFI